MSIDEFNERLVACTEIEEWKRGSDDNPLAKVTKDLTSMIQGRK